MPPSNSTAISDENPTDAPKTQLDPKVFWDACDLGGYIANHVCEAIERAARTVNDMLGIVCKSGFAICCLGIIFGLKTGMADPFRDLAILYCAGVLAANLGETYFGSRGLGSAIPIPVLLGIGLYTAPI